MKFAFSLWRGKQTSLLTVVFNFSSTKSFYSFKAVLLCISCVISMSGFFGTDFCQLSRFAEILSGNAQRVVSLYRCLKQRGIKMHLTCRRTGSVFQGHRNILRCLQSRSCIRTERNGKIPMTLAWQAKLGLNCTNNKWCNKNSANKYHIVVHNINNVPDQQSMCTPMQSLEMLLLCNG